MNRRKYSGFLAKTSEEEETQSHSNSESGISEVLSNASAPVAKLPKPTIPAVIPLGSTASSNPPSSCVQSGNINCTSTAAQVSTDSSTFSDIQYIGVVGGEDNSQMTNFRGIIDGGSSGLPSQVGQSGHEPVTPPHLSNRLAENSQQFAASSGFQQEQPQQHQASANPIAGFYVQMNPNPTLSTTGTVTAHAHQNQFAHQQHPISGQAQALHGVYQAGMGIDPHHGSQSSSTPLPAVLAAKVCQSSNVPQPQVGESAHQQMGGSWAHVSGSHSASGMVQRSNEALSNNVPKRIHKEISNSVNHLDHQKVIEKTTGTVTVRTETTFVLNELSQPTVSHSTYSLCLNADVQIGKQLELPLRKKFKFNLEKDMQLVVCDD